MAYRLSILLVLCLLLACSSQNQTETASADSTAIDSSTAISHSTETSPIANYSEVDPNLHEADTLFNLLARKKLVHGTFGDVTVITKDFLDPGNLKKSRNLIAVLVHSEGYEDDRSRTEHSALAVFETKADQLVLVDFLDIGASISRGLQMSSTESDSLMLAEGKFAAVIHDKSSEEGAGDSGYRNDDITIYVLLNEKITKVLEHSGEQFSFASDESSSYHEQTTTFQITVLNEVTNGLFDILIQTATYSSGFDEEVEESENSEEETEETEEETVTEEAPEASPDDGMEIFKWNMEVYVKTEG